MYFNQSKSDKNDSQNRKSGRSASLNQQRGSSGAYVKGGGGGPAPSPSITSGSSLSSNRSFKKSNNAQGSQSRVNPPTVSSTESNTASTARTTQNGIHVQPQLHGASDAQVTSGTAKSTESSAAQRSTRNVPKAPTSQPAPMSPDSAAPTTSAKAPGDSSKAFSFQFGSISPGFVNGMAIPARTSSAPPNLDEQKRDQSHHDSLRTVPSMPTPLVPKQPPRKDAGISDQSSAGEAHSGSNSKRDPQMSLSAAANQMQKPSVVPVTGISMAMPYHQAQASVQFGGPNPQIQSQGMPTPSLQMPIPMPLPIGSAPQVQQQVFVPGIQPHPMHHQGIMHQGQNMSFTPQMGPQIPHQLSNMGIGMTPQYPQQGGKFGGPRKTTTVKITHPETHEELRLDKRADGYSDGGSSGTRSHSNVPSQCQAVPSFAASHPINYYPPSSLFFPSASSLPLTTGQMTPNSQPARYNYPVNHGPQNGGFMNPSSVNSLSVSKAGTHMPGIVEPPNPEHSHDVHNVISSAPSGVTVTIKPSGGSGVVDSSLANGSISGVEKSESLSSSGPSAISSQQSKLSSDSSALRSLPKQSVIVSGDISTENHTTTSLIPPSVALSEDSVTSVSNIEGRRKESLSRSNSLKDNQKLSGKKGQSQHQGAVQSSAVSGLPFQSVDSGKSDSGVSETVETKTNHSAAISSETVPATQDMSSATGGSVLNAVEMKTTCALEGPASVSTEGSGAGLTVDSLNNYQHGRLEESSLQDKLLKQNSLEIGDKSGRSPEGTKENINNSVLCVESVTLKSTDLKQNEQDATKVCTDVPVLNTVRQGQDEPTSRGSELDRMSDNLAMPTSTALDSRVVTLSRNDSLLGHEAVSANSCSTDQQSADPPEATIKFGKDSGEYVGSGSMSTTKDKPILEPNKVKTTFKGKKKRREILQKADAAGSTSDLYNAYKGPEEKKEAIVSFESSESASASGRLKQLPADTAQPDAIAGDKGGQSKLEPDDWEDAADMSTPKLEVVDKSQQVSDGIGSTAKKYSRDFLLKFSEQCTDLPDGFEITADIAEALMSANINYSHVERDSHASPGRIIDRPGGSSRLDRRGSNVMEEDRWSKVPGPYNSGRDVRFDANVGGNAGFRPGQGGNSGVLRNPRAQAPLPYGGGILSGPMQSMGSQGSMQRNSPDGERWQRSASFQQRGLIPSPTPQTPLQMMHKAEKKYEVGRVADEEEAKQRQLKAILNKLTPQNFEKLFEQVKAVNIDNAVTLTGVISQIFEKALMEPTFCEMYANFCSHLASELPDLSEDNEKITFKRLLLNKCQEEFERGEREQEEANKVDEGEVKQSAEQREEKRIKARRRMLGNIRLIGELYKKKMLTERIMHECIKKLLGQYQDPDEEDVEALCKLMSTIGEIIDHPKAREHMDVYFERMKLLSSNMNMSSRVRFMLRDAIDLRKNKWQQKRKVEGPKKIEEVHRDAAQERQAQSGRLGRVPGNQSGRRIPVDFGPRGQSMLSSPNAQMGGLRGVPTQVRGFGSQDVRMEDRQSYESRTLSVTLPQRPLGDDSITLGPQGGLARGMSFRGSTAISGSPVSDVPGDARRMSSGLNGYSNVSERAPYSSRDDLIPRCIPDRFTGSTAYEQLSAQERSMNYGGRDMRNADRSYDRPVATSPPARVQGPTVSQNFSSEKVWPEERLSKMSIEAIKEFYSARDENEVALCVKDLNSPSFHPSMVSLWVSDSFERNDTERNLLAKLLVNLAKSQDGTLSQAQLIEGFESVLTTLEDAVNDAPRAAEFLGRIFAKVVTENVISFEEIGRLIIKGGQESGRLLKVGLAAKILGSAFESIKSEKGDAALSEIRTSWNLQLEASGHRILSYEGS